MKGQDVKITAATDDDEKWIERLEEGSNSSRTLVARVDGQRLLIRVTGSLNHEPEIDAICELLKTN